MEKITTCSKNSHIRTSCAEWNPEYEVYQCQDQGFSPSNCLVPEYAELLQTPPWEA